MRPVASRVFGLLHAGLAIVRSHWPPGHPGVRRGAAAERVRAALRATSSTRVVDGEDGLLRGAPGSGGRRRAARAPSGAGRERRSGPEPVGGGSGARRRAASRLIEGGECACAAGRAAAGRRRGRRRLAEDDPRREPRADPRRRAATAAPAEGGRGPGVPHSHSGRRRSVAPDLDAAVAGWKRAREHGFHTIVRELVPDSHQSTLWSALHLHRPGRQAARERRRRAQWAASLRDERRLHSAIDPEVHQLGQRLLRAAELHQAAHVELVRDPRDAKLKLLGVNTRPPILGQGSR